MVFSFDNFKSLSNESVQVFIQLPKKVLLSLQKLILCPNNSMT